MVNGESFLRGCVSNGVLQGSVVGSKILNIFISDLESGDTARRAGIALWILVRKPNNI